MVKTNNSIKNISCYNIIILLIITIFSSFKCYSVNNNEILALYQETAINTTTEPDKPPPSYEDATSGRNSNVLPTYQQALIIDYESRIEQEDTTLIETENSNLAQDVILNIPIEQSDDERNDRSCFYKFLKKNKKTILIEALPFVIVLAMVGMLGTLLYKKIIGINVYLPIALAIIAFYAVYISYLRKKCCTNSN